MKTLVTGATGFIGSHLVEELLKKGYNVACLVRKTSNLQWLYGLNVRLIYGDCAMKESLLNAVADYDYVFHLAGLTKAANEKDFFSANARGTENLVSAVKQKNPHLKRFIYLSSLAAAGPSYNGSPVNETAEPKPVSAYGKSKLEGERIVLRHKNAVSVTVIRPPAVYGPRDKDIYIFFKLAKKGISLSWGKCYYSFLYVEDLVKGIILSAENKNAEGEIFYLSDGGIYSNEEIAETIASAVGTKPLQIKIPKAIMPMIAGIGQKLSNRSNIISKDKVKELQHSCWTCDSSKSRDELGFIPNILLKEGIKWTADWYRIHQWL